MPTTVQPSLFELDADPTEDQATQYRHGVLVGDCLHVIASIYPEVDAAIHGLAAWSHMQRCEVAT